MYIDTCKGSGVPATPLCPCDCDNGTFLESRCVEHQQRAIHSMVDRRRSCDDGKSSNMELMYLSLALLAAPLRVPGVARMSLPINNLCPMLPPPVSSSELETVTLGMG